MGAELSSQSQQQQHQRRKQQHRGRGTTTPLSTEGSIQYVTGDTPSTPSPVPESEIRNRIASPACPGGTSGHQQEEKKNKCEVRQEIVIVSKGETEEETTSFTFPPAFKPLIPIGHESLPLGVPSIEPKLLTSLSTIFQSTLRSKAEFVLGQQLVLADIGKDIESYSSYVSNQTIAERSKRFVRIVDNFSKLLHIDHLVDKIDADLETCFQRLQSLNDFLPEGQRLEPFSYQTDNTSC